jgi:hypothetical protein
MARYTRLLGALGAFCFVLATTGLADWSDNFDDYEYSRYPSGFTWPGAYGGDDPNYDPRLPGYDPNLWEPNNPDWRIVDFAGAVFLVDANDGWLRLYVQESTLYPYGALLGLVDDGDWDPNTSTAYFDDSAPHYFLGQMKVGQPNENGEVALMVHLDPATYWFYCGDLEADDKNYNVALANGPDWYGRGSHARWDLDDANGFWMLVQWEGDGDPNHSYIRSAAWNGDKYDWDGFWDMDLNVLNAWDVNDVNYDYVSHGVCAVGCIKSEQSGPNDFTDVKFDNLEARWGRFGEYSLHTLTLQTVDANAVIVEPNWPQYPKGMVVLLETVCKGNKNFKKWKIKGPNGVGDPLYQERNDTNDILYLVMAGDFQVKAICKCGGGIEPFAGMALLVLGLTVVIRRLT